MKDLIEKILTYLPQYLTNFGLVFSGPKTFIASKNANADDAFFDAMLFLGVSVALSIIMTAPLQPAGKDLWTHVGSSSVVVLITVVLAATVVRIAWWIVGGRASPQSFFVTYAYFFGVIFVLLIAVQLLSFGFFKVFEPELYRQFIEASQKKQPMPDMSGSSIPLIALSIYGVGYVVLGFWGFLGWGAYRQLNGLGKLRSFGALMITGILTLPVVAVTLLIGAAIS
jgi:hypothetical protein